VSRDGQERYNKGGETEKKQRKNAKLRGADVAAAQPSCYFVLAGWLVDEVSAADWPIAA
jgi:hypothetical protein